MDAEALRHTTVAEPRDAMRTGLGLGFLDPGSPHVPYPMHESASGRDVPELRVDGLPISPVRWGETSPASCPLLALSEVRLRRYAPIDGPLSSTGGSVIDARLAPVPQGRALTAVRLTRGNYETFTEEAVLRRPIGPTDFALFWSDSKTQGHDLWGPQNGETFGMRLTHRMSDGGLEWIYDNARDRFRLLASKKGFWDRRAVGLRWFRADSVGTSVEASSRWSSMDAGWSTAKGLTQRETRAVDFRGRMERAKGHDRYGVTVEGELAATQYARPAQERKLLSGLDGFSMGVASGWSRQSDRASTRASVGLVRVAPLAVTGTFSLEHGRTLGGVTTVSVHASRAVRNRTLPRMPADGGAWVRQGLDLAAESAGEQPEGLWRAGVEARRKGGAAVVAAGLDGMVDTRGLDAGYVSLLGTDSQDEIPPEAQRRSCSFGSPWGTLELFMPLGLRIRAHAAAHFATGGTEGQMALPACEGDGALAWQGRFFKNDLRVDLALSGRARTSVETPYGRLPSQGFLDGEASARVADLDIFFVLANLTDAIAMSMTYDGRFMPMPPRTYRAGLRWGFTN